MKKILTVICAVLIIFAMATTTALAYEDTPATDADNVIVSDDSAPTVEESGSIHDNLTADSDGSNSEEERGWVDEAYGILLENADKIFALFAFLSSLLVGVCYKKGLLPLLKNALVTLGNGVATLSEQTEKADEITKGALSEAANRLRAAEECVSTVTERLASLEDELTKAREGSMKDKELRIILTSQIDMLYEIFMSSSLPTYQKDAIGEKVAAMKHALIEVTETE